MGPLLALLVLAALTAAEHTSQTELAVTELPLGPFNVEEWEWERFLRDNLEPDIGPWRAKMPLRTNDTFALYEQLMARHFLPAVFKLVLIYKNRIYWPNRDDVTGDMPPHPASPYKEAFHKKVGHLLETGRLTLPNVLFMFSSEDNRPRWCGPDQKCPVPLISLIKMVGEPDGNDTDILIPQFLFDRGASYHYPWHMKRDVAFFRGSPFCSGYWPSKIHTCSNICPRAYLAQKSHLDEQAGRPPVLNVSLVQTYIVPGPGECVPVSPPVAPRAPLAEHAMYKWVLHLEGITASNRLSQIMMTNSLVLVQQAPWIEYFYRSLQPNVHYVPFWNMSPAGPDDVYEVVADLRRREAEDPAHSQRIVHAAQTFAAKFTGMHARVRYLVDALKAYKSLFSDMDAFIEQYVEQLRGRGFQIP